MTETPKPLLRQNKELRKDNIWNFSLPAYVVQRETGAWMNVCPMAGACAKVCYALNGSYLFRNVREAHVRNLELALDSEAFIERMITELEHKRFRPKGIVRTVAGLDSLDHLSPRVQRLINDGAAAIRIHDGGDFFSGEYLEAWMEIADRMPDVLFYSYTKSVSMVREHMDSGGWPENFLICFSLGGKEDHLVDRELDQHADVFPTPEALLDAGYYDQEDNDLLCVLAPTTKVGIVVNNIPHFKKRQGDRTFGEMEASLTRHSRSTA